MAAMQPMPREKSRGTGRLAWATLAVLCIVVAAAPWLSHNDPLASIAPETLLPIGTHGFPLGSDVFGRDELSRLLWGGRSMIFTSILSVAAAMAIGFPVGMIAGYSQGWLSALLASGMDAMLSFPLILVSILLVAGLGPGTMSLVLALALSQAPVLGRVMMTLVRREAAREYVLAARASGLSQTHILILEITPNVLGPLLAQATSCVAIAAVYSAALSYLGLGVQPPVADWGYMVKEAQEYLLTSPWLSILPGALITIFVTACNFAGDSFHESMEARFN